MAHHPRFPALSSQYGEMAGTVEAAPGSAAQPSAMQELQLVCVAPSAGGRMGTQLKKLPGQRTRWRPLQMLLAATCMPAAGLSR